MTGNIEETKDFVQKLEEFPHAFKIVIAGNHEFNFYINKFTSQRKLIEERIPFLNKNKQKTAKEIITSNGSIIYLENTAVSVLGYNIYGSPFIPNTNDCIFQKKNVSETQIWDFVPDNTEILITHGPPLGFGDLTEKGKHIGCIHLLNTIRKRIKPKIHAFGHIHNDYGMWQDENTIYVNAAICDNNQNATRKAIVLDLPSKQTLNIQNKIIFI